MTIKRLITTLGLIGTLMQTEAQVDTTYYNNEGQEVHPALADYQRIAVCDTANGGLCQFIDRKMSGEKLASGTYRMTPEGIKYEGTFKNYTPEGHTIIESHYENGFLEGEQYEYDGNGGKVTKLYRNGVIQGDYYFYVSADGKVTKFSTKDSKMIWESPSVNERQTSYSHGTNWEYYVANNIVINATCSNINDYGKWYRVDLCITNGTNEALDLDPTKIFENVVDEMPRPTWSYEAYMKKVRRQQNWEAALVGVSAGLNAYNSSYSTSTVSTTTYNRGYAYTSYSTVHTYNPAGASMAYAQNQLMYSQMDMAQRASNAEKSNNYLRRTTLDPGESVRGYVLVGRTGRDKKIIVKAIINGAEYQFEWNVVK